MSQLAALMALWVWTLMGMILVVVALSPDATGRALVDRVREAISRRRWQISLSPERFSRSDSIVVGKLPVAFAGNPSLHFERAANDDDHVCTLHVRGLCLRQEG